MGQMLRVIHNAICSYSNYYRNPLKEKSLINANVAVPDTAPGLSSQSRTLCTGPNRFYDIRRLPPELAMRILGYLNATDLCLAACVWHHLAIDEHLWKRLCKNTWKYTTLYKNKKGLLHDLPWSWRRIYLLLDEATLTFNADAFEVFHFSWQVHIHFQYL